VCVWTIVLFGLFGQWVYAKRLNIYIYICAGKIYNILYMYTRGFDRIPSSRRYETILEYSTCRGLSLYQSLSLGVLSLMKISRKPIETEMAAGNVQIRVHLSVSRFSENPENVPRLPLYTCV